MTDGAEWSESCWKRIGIFGNRSCDRLDDIVHCRSCSIYQEAGRSLFDRPPSDESIDRWSELLAIIPEDDDTERVSLVIFRLGQEWFGLPANRVNEGIEPGPWRRIPHRSGREFLGLMNVRGDLLLYFSLHAMLGFDPEPADTYPLVLVCGETGRRLVFPVQELLGARRLALGMGTKPPVTIARASDAYTLALVETDVGRVAVLDADRLFHAMETKAR
jgi:chemotaxis-related protein WspD